MRACRESLTGIGVPNEVLRGESRFEGSAEGRKMSELKTDDKLRVDG